MACESTYKFVTWAKICSSKMASDYVKAKTHGYEEEANKLLDKVNLLDSLLDSVQMYLDKTADSTLKDGIIYLSDKEVTMSENNSLYLKSKQGEIVLSGTEEYCLSEEQICSVIEKIKSLCSNC